MKFLNKLFRKKKLTVQEELDKVMKRVDDAYAKYEKNPTIANTYYLDGLLDITERLVSNLERIPRPSPDYSENIAEGRLKAFWRGFRK
jgi:hypothetical protein